MNVSVEILFNSPGEAQRKAMQSLARALTNDPKSVRVFAGKTAGVLVAEFTMLTEAQYAAVSKIDRAIRYYAGDRLDSGIAFPKTEEERARAKRKAARRRSRRGR